MEIFLELVLAISFSLLFSFFLAKILSLSSPPSTNCQYDLVSGLKPCQDLFQKAVTCERGSDGEKRDGSVANFVEGEDLGELKKAKIILDDCCGSCDNVNIDENEALKEVKVQDLMGRVVEEIFGEFGGSCGCSESENFAKFETYLTKYEASVAKSEGIEVLESKCHNEIDEASKNEEDGGMCRIFDCEEIVVDESNFFEVEKIAKLETDLAKDEVGVAKSEGKKVLECKYVNEIIEANKNEKEGGKNNLFGCKQILMDRSTSFEGGKTEKIETEFSETKMSMARSDEVEILESTCDNEIGEGNKVGEDDVKGILFDEDDDWEGIERTELERLFGAAVAFVGNKCNADRISTIGSDVKMQLYGLHKIATIGPCHRSQPMALKVFARANWNAWKQLGNMTPEIAMEQYVNILSRSIPGCIQDDIRGDIKRASAEAEACSKLASDLKAYQAARLGAVDERNVDELMPHPESF